MAWAQDQWQQLVQVSKGEAHPSFDPQQEAADALQQLLGADVVLTSYEVLRQEVHYSPESASVHSLRRAKKYAVPESPLLSVRSGAAAVVFAAVPVVSTVPTVGTLPADVDATEVLSVAVATVCCYCKYCLLLLPL